MKYLLRFVFVVAGLIFAASLMLAMLVLLIVWSIRAFWRKLTGQPAMPFVMRMSPRAGFEQVFRQGQHQANTPAKPSRRVLDDVTDVEPKH
jgi:hypothetical protein